MAYYAHIINGMVAKSPFTPPEGFSIADCLDRALMWIGVSIVAAELVSLPSVPSDGLRCE
jgi:hypothetical protein